jgi:hypothetical protein
VCGLKIPVSGVQFSPCPPFLCPAKRRNPALGLAFRHFGSRESFGTSCDPLGWFLTAVMPQRGGPWRLAGYAILDGRSAREAGAPRELATPDGDRGLRWIVSGSVLAVIGGGLVALVGGSSAWR